MGCVMQQAVVYRGGCGEEIRYDVVWFERQLSDLATLTTAGNCIKYLDKILRAVGITRKITPKAKKKSQLEDREKNPDLQHWKKMPD